MNHFLFYEAVENKLKETLRTDRFRRPRVNHIITREYPLPPCQYGSFPHESLFTVEAVDVPLTLHCLTINVGEKARFKLSADYTNTFTSHPFGMQENLALTLSVPEFNLEGRLLLPVDKVDIYEEYAAEGVAKHLLVLLKQPRAV